MDFLKNKNEITQRLWAPLTNAIAQAKSQYHCKKVSDTQWIEKGILRVLGEAKSGCDFLQKALLKSLVNTDNAKKSNYFECFKSKRRLEHLTHINTELLQEHANKALKEIPDARAHESLKDFHLYAGDGHFHAASSHELRDEKNSKNAVAHLYALNLRTHLLSHLTFSSAGGKKKPHDMGALKKLDKETLRQGAQKGEKALYIWDRAGIDFKKWHQWKNNDGIYFLSRSKTNMRLSRLGHHRFDKENPLNAGILFDEQVGNEAGYLIRRVTYLIPETNEKMEFITTLGSQIPPGVIVQLYFMRWRIEKSFDTFKNKLYEQKAWGKSDTSKRMQAQFMILAYNLAQLLNASIEKEHGIKDEKNITKRKTRLQQLEKKLKKENRSFPTLRKTFQIPSQLSVKFYRWLRVHLFLPSSWQQSLKQLKQIYALF